MAYQQQPAYPPPPAYHPPPPGYPQPPAPQPVYGHPPQQQTQVVVMTAQQAAPTHTVVVQRAGVNHALHFIITLLFWPWIIVWIILCITE